MRKDLGGSTTVNTGNNINEAGASGAGELFPQQPPPPHLVVATKSKPAQQVVHSCKDCYLAFNSLAQLKSHVRQVCQYSKAYCIKLWETANALNDVEMGQKSMN